jgi:hypothetical protein
LSPELITSANRWHEILAQLPDFPGKIYYTWHYHNVCSANGDGTPAAFFYSSGSCQIFHPFLMRPIPAIIGGDGFFDLETAYGYGGPQAFNASDTNLVEFKNDFAAWATHNSVVAEFVRFNPLTHMHARFADFYQISHNRVTTSINLDAQFSEILGNCTGPRQRNWRTACRLGLSLRQLPDLKSFQGLYHQTMRRLQARPYYLFSKPYFEAIEQLPPQNRFFAGAFTPDNQLAAAAIFLLDSESAHYHLGASDENFRNTRANAFLMLEFARQTAGSNTKILHLGGGGSLAEDDSLFRFKAGFSRLRHDFFIGKRLHQPDVYHKLSRRWQKLTGCQPEILLHYHYGANDENL